MNDKETNEESEKNNIEGKINDNDNEKDIPEETLNQKSKR